jgi:hypothetical protein
MMFCSQIIYHHMQQRSSKSPEVMQKLMNSWSQEWKYKIKEKYRLIEEVL